MVAAADRLPPAIYIRAMNLRGPRGRLTADVPADALKVNVTSMQARASKYRKDFSPMDLGTPHRGEGLDCAD